MRTQKFESNELQNYITPSIKTKLIISKIIFFPRSIKSNLSFELHDLLKHKVTKLYFAIFRNNLPPLISHLFTKTSKIFSRITRSSTDPNTTLYILRYRTARLQRCIKYQGVKIWSDIPTKIKNRSFNHFKCPYKNYLLNQYWFFSSFFCSALLHVATFYHTLQRWSPGHKARGQGQGHKKNPRPRPRTAFPRTDTLEAKDRNA